MQNVVLFMKMHMSSTQGAHNVRMMCAVVSSHSGAQLYEARTQVTVLANHSAPFPVVIHFTVAGYVFCLGNT